MKVQFTVRLFHCPTCDSLYEFPIRSDAKDDTERICGRCWRRDMEESDADRHEPVDKYTHSG